MVLWSRVRPGRLPAGRKCSRPRGPARGARWLLMALPLLASGTPSLARTVQGSAPPSSISDAHHARVMAVVESLWVAGRTDSLWKRVESELGLARSRGDSSLVLDLLAQRGQGRARLGQIREAEPDLRAATRMAERQGNGRTLRSSLRWLA
jgi:hypothetical protein